MSEHKYVPGKTIEVDGCWLHQSAPVNKYGHCKVRYDGKKVYVHRLSAHLYWGFDLESSMLILHRCKHANCWNPQHLYEGTKKDNTADSIEAGTFKNVIADREREETICMKGHPLDGVRGNGKRYCKTCNRQRAGYFS